MVPGYELYIFLFLLIYCLYFSNTFIYKKPDDKPVYHFKKNCILPIILV